jgi:nicotinate-nucleotide--dimethylbenzimidazole phosphoribosyltransferase
VDLTIPALAEEPMTAANDLLRHRHGKLDGLAVWLAGVQGSMPPKPLGRKRVVVFGDSLVKGDVQGVGGFDDGVALAGAEVDAGADLFVVVSPRTLGATVLVAALTNSEPVEVVPNGRHWATQVAEVRDALRAHRGAEPLALAAAIGDAAMAGFLAGAAKRRTPVLLDGLAPAAAALVAQTVAPLCVTYFAAAHVTPDPAHRRALESLGLTPLLDLGIKADGAALLALPLLDAAVELLHELG